MFRRAFTQQTARIVSLRQSAPALATTTRVRAIHSPFTLLGPSQSPLETMPKEETVPSSAYQKQTEEFPLVDEQIDISASRTYVVSTPDPADTPYEVPSGAYPSNMPYKNPEARGPPIHEMDSSTGLSPAHPNLTQRVPTNDAGVGESSGVRYRSAPGEMGARGGSEYGTGMMDHSTTKPGAKGELADRNPPPLAKESELFSKKGNAEAWKERK